MTKLSPKPKVSENPLNGLSEAIRAGLDANGLSAESLVDRIRVSPDTIDCLLAGDSAQRRLDFMPEVYVRGHLKLIVEELDLDAEKIMALYEKAYGQPAEETETMEVSVLPFRTVALTAGLAGMGILAVIVAFLGG